MFKPKNILEVRRFMNGYYWYFGLRLAFAVLVPSILLYRYGLLTQYMIVPFGTLQLGLTDVIGSIQRRFGALFIGTACFFCCAVLACLVQDIFWLQLIILLILAFVFSMMGVYGTRMQNIGMSSIIASIFFMDKHFAHGSILQNSFQLAAGCFIYIFIFFVSYKIRPYKLIQQMLGEHIIEIAKYMDGRRAFYATNIDENFLPDNMIREQIVIREQQESLREIILKSDVSADKFSNKSRALLIAFMDVIDLYELIMSSQQDYRKLHKAFDRTHILAYFGKYIGMLANELQSIGLAVQRGKAAEPETDLDKVFEKVSRVFYQLRKEKMNHDNMDEFLALRQILYLLQSLNERIKKLYSVAAFDKDAIKDFKSTAKDYAAFLPQQNYDYHLFFNSFSFHSGMFRHALRLTFALFAGWMIGLIFMQYKVGHVYWIMMTIVIVVKPAYSQSRIKNLDRITGTFIGGVLSLLISFTVRNEAVIFSLLVLATLITCTFSKIYYKLYTTGITMLVVLSYYFLAPKALDTVLIERLLNSFAGAVIGYVVSLFVLPNWENKNVQTCLNEMLDASKNYFSAVSDTFINKAENAVNIKLLRKKALIALANLSDNFQRMTSDPKSRQKNAGALFRLVSINYMLTSYIVSLAQYAAGKKHKFDTEKFQPSSMQIEENYSLVKNLLADKSRANELKKILPANEYLNNRMHEAKVKLLHASPEEKENIISIRKSVTDLRTVNELYRLINTSVCDAGKIIASTVFE